MRVQIPSPLHGYSGGASAVDVEGATLADLVADLDRRFPGIGFRIIDEQDRIRTHIWFYIDGRMVRDTGHPVRPDSDVKIVCALSGG